MVAMQQSQKQAIRLRRTVLANLGLLFNIFLGVLAQHWGYVVLELPFLLLLLVGSWIGHLTFVVLIYSSTNLYFKDASLTLAQVLWALVSLTILMCFMQGIRPLVLMGYLLIMLFGSFRLSMGEFYSVTVVIFVCYTSSLLVIYFNRPQDILLSQEFFIFLGFSVVLLGFVFMGVEFSQLRQNLSQRHKDLKGALMRIQELAITDELTRLYNRRHLFALLAQQRALANRSQYRFVVCYLDLDHFKKVNDQYGHPFGDKVLVAFADLINASLREVDIGARIGGEEFVLILTNTDLNTAQSVCQRISEQWALQSFKGVPSLSLTLSCGIAEFSVPETVEQLLERGDKLLYKAKNNGRNCIVVEEPEHQEAFKFETAEV
jgi:diguanylate cyclase (GGDEF)-like protein